MPAPTFNMAVFRLQVSGGTKHKEIRILLDDGTHDWTAESAHDWLENHPTDAIILNDARRYFPSISPIAIEELNNEANMVPTAVGFEFNDFFDFSGIINGVDTGFQNLKDESTSFFFHFFQGIGVNRFRIWEDWCNIDWSFVECHYAGEIRKTSLTSDPFYTEQSMTSTQAQLCTYHLESDNPSEALSKVSVQDIVENITQSDMGTSDCAQFLAGMIFNNKDSFGNGTGKGKLFQKNFDIDGAHISAFPKGYRIDNTNFLFSGMKNIYGVGHGFQGISIANLCRVILRKINCNYGGADKTYATYINDINRDGTHGGYDYWTLSEIIDPDLSEVLYVNYNYFLGVNPNQYRFNPLPSPSGSGSMFSGTDAETGAQYEDRINADFQNGILRELTIASADTSTDEWVIETSAPHELLTAFQAVLFKDNTDHYFGWGNIPIAGGPNDIVSGTWVTEIVDDTHFKIKMVEESFLPSHGSTHYTAWPNTPVKCYFPTDAYYADPMNSPAGFKRNQLSNDVLRQICFDDSLKMIWGIGQTGINKGVNTMYLKDISYKGIAASSKFANLAKLPGSGGIKNSEIRKDVVSVSHAGDNIKVHSPHKPRYTDEILDRTIFKRLKRWGEFGGYIQENFVGSDELPIFDRGQEPIYNGGGTQFFRDFTNCQLLEVPLTPYGYILATYRYYLFDASRSSNYPSGLSSFHPNFDRATLTPRGSQTDGFYAVSYQQREGGMVDATNFNPDGFNAIVLPAQHVAAVYLANKTETVWELKELAGESAVTDDSGSTVALYSGVYFSVRNGYGNLQEYRSNKMSIDTKNDKLQLTAVEVSSDSITEQPYVFDNGTHFGNGSGGAAMNGSGGGSGGGSSSISGVVLKNAITNDTNIRTLQAGAQIAEFFQEGTVRKGTFLLDVQDTGNDNSLCLDTNNKAYMVIRLTDPGGGVLTGAFDWTGFGAMLNVGTLIGGLTGQHHTIWNDTAFPCSIKHSNSNSDSEKRFKTPDGQDYVLAPGSFVDVIYDDTYSHWAVVANGTPISTIPDKTVLGNDTGGTSAPIAISFDNLQSELASFAFANGDGIVSPAVDINLRTNYTFTLDRDAIVTPAVITDPQTSTRNKMESSVANTKGWITKAKASDLLTNTAFENQDDSGNVNFKVRKNGSVVIDTSASIPLGVLQGIGGLPLRRFTSVFSNDDGTTTYYHAKVTTTNNTLTTFFTLDASTTGSYKIYIEGFSVINTGGAGTVGNTNDHECSFIVKNIGGTVTVLGKINKVATTDPTGTSQNSSIGINPTVTGSTNVNFQFQGQTGVNFSALFDIRVTGPFAT